MHRRTLLVLVSVGMAAGALTACGGRGGNPDSLGTGDGTETGAIQGAARATHGGRDMAGDTQSGFDTGTVRVVAADSVSPSR
ncbi:MAG TPA: hypothetical protein VFW66_09570 [Gemmatimonadales bacterium]|nr:hypothetical protein [Gemmatimonadales bacterium]